MTEQHGSDLDKTAPSEWGRMGAEIVESDYKHLGGGDL